MAAMTARQKFDRSTEPKRSRLTSDFAGVPAGSLLYVSTPRVLDEYIRGIPWGEMLSIAELRDALARHNEADATCPVTTAMYLRVVAELALEELHAGTPIEEVAPFWRVIDAESPIAGRVMGARDLILARRREEGAVSR
jgi:hypothetical protein